MLALKECIRALRKGDDADVPYRGSYLTLVLRDSFEGTTEDKKVVMISCVCPGHTSSDHSLNSLRYADRLKEQSAGNVVNHFVPKPEVGRKAPAQPSVKKMPQPKAVEKKEKVAERQEKLGRSFKDMEYIHSKNSEEEKIGREMLDLHEKVETIIEEEEELLEIHVAAIKEDAQILTKEGELIALAQGEGDYEIDSYVEQMELLIHRKLKIYQNFYNKILTFKAHLNEEEDISKNITQNFNKNKKK